MQKLFRSLDELTSSTTYKPHSLCRYLTTSNEKKMLDYQDSFQDNIHGHIQIQMLVQLWL
uniref:Uncharacterized protein n=1 Tax=Arion vulgaris TaxID=1028688 RepID=A0A0B6YRU0_9EUPU